MKLKFLYIRAIRFEGYCYPFLFGWATDDEVYILEGPKAKWRKVTQ